MTHTTFILTNVFFNSLILLICLFYFQVTCICNSLSLWCDLRNVRQLLKRSKTEEEELKQRCKTLNAKNQRLRVECLRLRTAMQNYQRRYDVAEQKMDLIPLSLRNATSRSLPYLYPIRTRSLPTSLQNICLSGSWLELDIYSEVQDAVTEQVASGHALPRSDELEMSEIGCNNER
jgi:hypothetical protein